MSHASLRAAAVDRTNAADYVAFLFNLADQNLRDFLERSGHPIPRAHEAACLCLDRAEALDLLSVLRMEANLEMQPPPGWVRVCVLGAGEAYAFVLVEIDPSAPGVTTGSVRRLVDLGAAIEAAFGVPVFMAIHLPDSALP